jgi:hypothetical protein
MKDEQDPRNTRYYHGGDAGLLVGQFILPSLVTGKDNMVGLNPLWKKDRVYVIKDIAGAMFFASASKRPTVYEVTPEGDLENDPDDKIKGRSFACPKAKIIAIHSVPPEVVRRNCNWSPCNAWIAVINVSKTGSMRSPVIVIGPLAFKFARDYRGRTKHPCIARQARRTVPCCAR